MVKLEFWTQVRVTLNFPFYSHWQKALVNKCKIDRSNSYFQLPVGLTVEERICQFLVDQKGRNKQIGERKRTADFSSNQQITF